jgi:homoserine O-acetyltransferase/O-succinyltransferase
MDRFLRVVSLIALVITSSVVCTISSAQLASPPVSPVTSALTTPQLINLGECKLESGATIRDCKIGVITIGTLNGARDNAILFPTWYGGKSSDLARYVGADKLVDPAKYFVILADSFGNGVSSSPSNSATQSGAAFPAVSIRDMLSQQKRVVTEHFKLTKLHAVIGISMGAMQALEWSVRENDFANKFVAIAGSPRLAPYDIVLWETIERALQSVIECQCQRPMQILAGTRFLMQGADVQAKNVPHEALGKVRADIEKASITVPLAHDRILQLRAMVGHDVSRDLGSDLALAAKRAGNKLLTLAGNKDNIVTPEPVIAFGKLSGNATLEFPTCGHDIPMCQSALIFPTVRDFLTR